MVELQKKLKKIITIAGARPNFMKIAPIIKEMEKRPWIDHLLVHTGQHYDNNMSSIFFRDLGLAKPDIHLEVGSGTHAQQTAQIMLRVEPIMIEQQPDLVMVVGDVNSTLACSLVAAKLGVKIAHVEAGVRSFDRTMPEEINRIITDTLADLLFTPSLKANENLIQVGIPKEKIFFVGNVMVDTLLSLLNLSSQRASWSKFGLKPSQYALLTLHRPSNVDDRISLTNIIQVMVKISERVPIIIPLHPRTQKRLTEFGLEDTVRSAPNLIISEPLGYLDFLCLLDRARFVLTDSGGIQTETTILGVPCLTIRSNTEWPETIQQGTNQLVGTDYQSILTAVDTLLENKTLKLAHKPELWDGKTAERILEIIEEVIYHR